MNRSRSQLQADPQDAVEQPPIFEAIQRIPESAPANQLRRLENIKRLGLERSIVELDTMGYTVIPPELVGPKAEVDK